MALELVKLDSGTLPAIANAIREKTGDTALLLPSQMPNAIAGIPSGGDLPPLTYPAAESDVLSGKEYIGAAGEKRTGTLVVCDTVYDVETLPYPGTGLTVDLESTVDGSSKTMTLPEENLKSENIKSGISIFNVAGSVKEIRIETGTITPAEDTTTITIPCSNNPKYAVLLTTSDTKAEGDITGAVIYSILYDGKFAGNCFAGFYYSGNIRSASLVATFDSGISIPEISAACFYRAGVEYQWTAYYWEDNA